VEVKSLKNQRGLRMRPVEEARVTVKSVKRRRTKRRRKKKTKTKIKKRTKIKTRTRIEKKRKKRFDE